MTRWFSAQPIHRKLVITSMAKTTLVLLAAMISLLVVDSLRFRAAATDDARTLAMMVAENIRAALAFGDSDQIVETLQTLRNRVQVERACVYLSDGSLVSQFSRDLESQCSDVPPGDVPWFVLSASAPVIQEGQAIGTVFLERDWKSLQDRLRRVALTSSIVLVVASLLMFVISHRLHRTISEPIRRLAAAARITGKPGHYAMPVIEAPDDEVGELVTAFRAMVDRVRVANEDLARTNDVLRREIEERRIVEKEREALLQREQETNRIKDEFLATVSHELRTPLSAILGWAGILSTTRPDEATVEKAAASLHRNALIQARVIDDLIDISRIVTGKLRVVTEPVDLRQAVEAAVDAIRPSAEHAGIDLQVSMPGDACVILGDKARLHQIVWNLLSNAVKFASGGRVTVTLAGDGSHQTLTVTDDGVGIAPEFIEHVFSRFRQADSSITREHGGLGIGLAVVKELVDLHGGSIRVSSRGRGHGAEFVVELPCFDGDAGVEGSQQRVPSLAGISVLAIDDNADALEVIEATLTRAGATVRTALSGAAALAHWQEAQPDVVLCDLAMPQMSGFEVLERIRALDQAQGRVTPAIAVTAHATEEQITRSAQAGFQAHVAKPFDAARLVRAVFAARMLV